MKELAETEYWFELLMDENIVPPAKMSALLDECRQLIAIFTTIINKSRGAT